MNKIAFLVPAYNEGEVISETLKSLLGLTKAKNIYVVDDGSDDNTRQVALQYTINVLTLYPNIGKAGATNQAIKAFGLITRYKYLMPMDADSKVDKNFVKNALPVLEKDKQGKVVGVVGKVVSRAHNWITFYRVWEYEIAQSVHKKAQSEMDAIIVCPGCATIYRSEIFRKTRIPEGTLTEDMDFTFTLHRKKLGKIVFTDKAIVSTQDPKTLADFLKQIDRWYTGFWQCLTKHNIPWGGQALDVELAMLALEGLFNSLIVLSFLFLIPLTLRFNPKLLLIPFLVDLFLFFLPTIIYTVRKHRVLSIFKYMVFFYFIRIISSLYFLKSFTKVVLGFDLKMKWNKAERYQLIT